MVDPTDEKVDVGLNHCLVPGNDSVHILWIVAGKANVGEAHILWDIDANFLQKVIALLHSYDRLSHTAARVVFWGYHLRS